MPDAIDFYSTGGTGYLVMANEGDSREFGSVIDANRISSSTYNNLLDATAFPDQAILRNNKFLGRLSALKYSGDTDGDGDYDELHIMGGRSFSIRNASTGAIVFDSKALMEQITANHPTFGAIFNASNATGAPALKNRSDDKGPEPEGIKIAQINGKMYAFVALERIGGAMMFNVTNPNNPIYVGYANNRSTTLSGPDLGAEGIIYISAAESPNGNAILILANEVSSTLSIYQINSCAELSGAPISTQNNTICAGQNTSISATPTVNVSYEWLQNNLPIQNANQVNYAATTAGTYSLKVTNSTLTCVDTTNSIQITVNSLPVVSAGQSQSVCTGASTTLNGSGASTYTWNNNVTNGVAFTPAATQTYTVTGTDVNGCQNTAQVIVTVNALPVVSAGQAQAVCSGAGVTLNGSGASTYTWNNNVTNGVAFTPVATQTYTVTGTDVNGCQGTSQVTVTVNTLPVVSAGQAQTLCAGASATLNGSGASTYTWNNNVTNGVTFTPQATQTYTVTGTDANACQNTAQVIVTVNALPVVSAGQTQTVCVGTSATLNGSGASTYSWDNNVTNGVSFTPNTTQTYTVTGIDVNGCQNTAQVSITVNPLPTVNAGTAQNVCPGIQVTLTASGASTYVWDNNISNGQAFTPNASGIYTVIGTDLNGCEDTAQVSVNLFTAPSVNLGNDTIVCEYNFPYQITATGTAGATYSWDNGSTGNPISVAAAGLYTVTVTDNNGCTSTDDIVIESDPCAGIIEQGMSIILYPNPFNENVQITSTESIDAQLEVYGSDGRIVYSTRMNGQYATLSLANLARGNYLVKIVQNGTPHVTKLVKQ
jgi:Secretion system C-terminal sorting domain